MVSMTRTEPSACSKVLTEPEPARWLRSLAARLKPPRCVQPTGAVVMARYEDEWDQVVGCYGVFEMLDAVKRAVELERSPEIRRQCLRFPDEIERVEVVFVYDRVVEVVAL